MNRRSKPAPRSRRAEEIGYESGKKGHSAVKEGAGLAPAFGDRSNIEQIRKGLPVRSLYQLKAKYDLTDDLLIHVVGFSKSTLGRLRKTDKALDPVSSDRLYRFERILDLAAKVFEDEGAGFHWLCRSQPGLSGNVPLDLLDTEPGAQAVEDLLVQLDNAVYP